MVKKNSNIDKTLKNISLSRETPKSAFVLLILIYGISHFLVVSASSAQGVIMVADTPISFSAFAGVFSMVGNTCIICLVMLFRRVGYIVSIGLLLLQLPMMFVNILARGNMSALPGLFSCIMIVGTISIIHFSYRKILMYQQSIREQAITDRITGLPNRFACGELTEDFQKRNERFSLVSIDLNDFKSINDTMGHDTGDKVLKVIADRWKELANNYDSGTVEFIARNSGDEFILVISEYGSTASIEKTIAAYRAELEKKISIDDCDYFLTACFGYVLFPEDTDIIDNLYLYADAAVHEAKKSGTGSRILRFSPEFLNTEKAFEIERKIRSAISGDKIFFHLQPQFDLEHKLRGFEALARIKDDNGTFISPADFIPVAEKTGLVDKIDARVFELAVDFLDKVSQETNTDVMLSVNVSVRHLMKNNFIEDIKRVLASHSVAPERIEIEITESIMIDSAEKALQRINEIKDMGLKVAIDDFGTGFSSLSYLNSFPSDMLKIDKSFIDQMNQSDSSKQYVAIIISIGHILDLKVISEGVESVDQVDVLKGLGCDYIQGFVWGRPMPPEEARALVIETR